MVEISIAICSYNRAELLKNNFLRIIDLKLHDFPVEFILIDNNSTDNTKEVIDEFVNIIPNFRAYTETQQGLSFARNRAYVEAKAEYVAYIDDDAQLTEGWVQKALLIIQEQKPDAFGGPIYPFYLSPKPDWFKDEYEIRKHFDRTDWMPESKSLSGSNMVFKRLLLHEYNGFDKKLGMKGEKMHYGEETDLLNRMHRNKCKIYYDTDLVIEHWVPEHKMTLAYQMYYPIENAVVNFEIHQQTISIPIEPIAIEISESIDQLHQKLKDVAEEQIKGGKTNFEDFYMQEIYPILHRLGFLSEQLKWNKKRNRRSLLNKILNISIEKIFFVLKNKFR